ncbi:hypothetical protein [Pseudoalteromonas luteoviolacea]|uniref:Uncharacterized protein n=1 Tax=Pseudoalteromonas luteoviolacea S4054 TaxID=1129367 RepID=A0A0F6ACA4_9GAMM|nr:hypothetical protein [Pseudoalteromonas luteoviolacea]AOT06710.1 hypothetical protein S4054249_01900 [Pseudoalteromonas luteoviolacea]AOT11628.1 hypothetical protein S40542_01900 [Pseudoalteromonas luteoviolacea]AOT16540.1 hypothetical protein S4054_01900 [Pseudoalteromonas luteoviolacea]KKE83798.1 hypothetical protein N479_12460 [Pseudoalteromonas luteoviolacea S4054]KZN73919.1 hypothetical protein N481_10795 [Pseudoalteromonas luteoviolacea S4047-1]
MSKVHIFGEGGTVVLLAEEVPINPGHYRKKTMVYIHPDLKQYNQMVSAVLAAHAQDKTVGFWSSGCSTNYFWGSSESMPRIRDLWVN